MNINDLRNTLFETLQAVKRGEMDTDRAKTISDISQTIINTAKVEIDFAKATGYDINSSFIEQRKHTDAPRIPSISAQLELAGKKAS